jgi:hypothetical protein
MKSCLSLSAAVAAVALVAACGKPENENFPKHPGEVDLEQEGPVLKRWKALAAYLKIPDGTQGGNETALVARLSQTSGWLAPAQKAAFSAELGKIVNTYVANAYRTQCSKITSIAKVSAAQKWNATTGVAIDLKANVYLMKYLLQADAQGTPEAQERERSALVVVPTRTNEELQALANDNAKKIPLVLYGHGGDKGSSYQRDLAALFGGLQESHIIAAPAFPAEPVCAGGISPVTQTCDEKGKLAESSNIPAEPYNNDVDDFLGLQDCLTRVSYHFPIQDGDPAAVGKTLLSAGKIEAPAVVDLKTKAATGENLNTFLTAAIKRHEFKAAPVDVTPLQPVTYFAGSSRGAFVSQLALARVGGALQGYSSVTKSKSQSDALQAVKATFGPRYLSPAKVSCFLNIFGPSTLLVGRYRIGFESFVRGYGDKTAFYRLPGGPYLFEKFSGYGKGKPVEPQAGKTKYTEAELTENAARAIWKMDIPLQAPLMLGALRNWTYLSATLSNSVADADKGKIQGSFLTVHGNFDRIVPVEQSLVGATTLFATNAALSTGASPSLPGAQIHALGFSPPAEFLTKNDKGEPVLKGSDPKFPNDITKTPTHHGDRAFGESKASTVLFRCGGFEGALKTVAKHLFAFQAFPHTRSCHWHLDFSRLRGSPRRLRAKKGLQYVLQRHDPKGCESLGTPLWHLGARRRCLVCRGRSSQGISAQFSRHKTPRAPRRFCSGGALRCQWKSDS